ncbi:ThiF family adenylyltransferase [Haloplasma contractile]|uniref:4-methyl-5-thiazole monophosphate synthesis protein ThiF n=1 Tax=Haloplasma contractile SSD-17B TaxID=1033810 RepID=F7PTW8_9MOLU|nr:ThiF family adenylyltransferase [Haloplasma contractile]ERJ12286.1 4-methyl-5-thiazole monophosphate synthesis protein ThiF [Haloplasma contractile SSD-17B]
MIEYDVALTNSAQSIFRDLMRDSNQERLTFFFWRESKGVKRITAVIDNEIPLPNDEELNLNGNVSFKQSYLLRVLANIPENCGLGLIHNHFTPGWQKMSKDDITAEREELAPIIYSKTKKPLLGLTIGTDGTISGRFWLKKKQSLYHKVDVRKIRIVDKDFKCFYNPGLSQTNISNRKRKIATMSVWGDEHQKHIEDFRVAIVGLGSVGSLVVSALARIGVRKFYLIDFDRIEERNLDRTDGAKKIDSILKRKKINVAKRNIKNSATSSDLEISTHFGKLEDDSSLTKILDCDFIFSCVDKHYPRYVLNYIAISHLIPVIDGGVLIELSENLHGPRNISWRTQIIAPSKICMDCGNVYDYGKVQDEKYGQAKDAVYINVDYNNNDGRENVFSFSMNLASLEVNLFLGYVTSIDNILNYKFNQLYHAIGGVITLNHSENNCKCNCVIKNSYTAKALNLKQLVGK